MRREGRGSAQVHATRSRGFSAGCGPFSDQAALELGDAGEDRHDELSACGRRVRPGLGQRAEADSLLGELIHNVQKIPRRTRQAIKAGDDHHVAGLALIYERRQARPVHIGAGALVFVNDLTAGPFQDRALRVQILAGGGDARISSKRGKKPSTF